MTLYMLFAAAGILIYATVTVAVTRVDEIATLGVRRIRVGGALAPAAWTGFMHAAQTLRSKGSFAGLANLVPYPEINRLFAADLPGRPVQTDALTQQV